MANDKKEILLLPDLRGKTEIKLKGESMCLTHVFLLLTSKSKSVLDMTADFKSNIISCQSIRVPEYLATIFSIALMFSSCKNRIGQCDHWPLLAAIGLDKMRDSNGDTKKTLADKFSNYD